MHPALGDIFVVLTICLIHERGRVNASQLLGYLIWTSPAPCDPFDVSYEALQYIVQ